MLYMFRNILKQISNRKDKFSLIYLSSIVISHLLWDRAFVGLYLDNDFFVNSDNIFSLKKFKKYSPICNLDKFNNIPRNIIGILNITYSLPITIFILKEFIKKRLYTDKSITMLKRLQMLKIISNTIVFSYDLIDLIKNKKLNDIIFKYLSFVILTIFQIYNLNIVSNKYDILFYESIIILFVILLVYVKIIK